MERISLPPEDGRRRGSKSEFTFDTARIAARAQVLFPFLTPGISWNHFALTPRRTLHRPLQNPLAALDSRQHGSLASPPLKMDDVALQRLIDKSWSRRHRWSAFQPIVSLAGAHDPDVGQLPTLLQKYCDQNSLQPYADTTIQDPRIWVLLGIAADQADFIGFIRRYASEHSSTKATTALLFLLDNMVQANRDALDELLQTDPAVDMVWTRETNPQAYDLVTQLRQYYGSHLARRGLTSSEALNFFYESVRLEILTAIVRTTPDGYRANDARFLIGAIYWRQQRFQDALLWWQEMTIDREDSYAGAYSQVLRVLEQNRTPSNAAPRRIDPTLNREIRQILKNQHGRWLMLSYDRLRHFGYRFDTF